MPGNRLPVLCQLETHYLGIGERRQIHSDSGAVQFLRSVLQLKNHVGLCGLKAHVWTLRTPTLPYPSRSALVERPVSSDALQRPLHVWLDLFGGHRHCLPWLSADGHDHPAPRRLPRHLTYVLRAGRRDANSRPLRSPHRLLGQWNALEQARRPTPKIRLH